MTYETLIEELESQSQGTGLSSEAVEAAADAMSFVAALHGLFVANGVLNEDAAVDVGVLENIIDAQYGELGAAAILLSEASFNGISDVLKATAKTMEDKDNVVPATVRKGFERLAQRIEKTKVYREQAAQALANSEKAQKQT